jgi:prepilin-type N-terminal cleavage/methylation domain-containing protein
VNRNGNKGFSLVELLAVVLVLSALAAIAIPLYASQRQSAQARVCIANIAAISASCSAYALRLGAYPTTSAIAQTAWNGTVAGGLVGAPEGLAAWPTCPSTGAAYTYAVAAGQATIACPNIATHAAYGPAGATYTTTLAAPGTDSLP